VGKAAEEAVGHSKSEDGVTHELKLFVICCRGRGCVRIGLVGERAMRERER
jgi:hypothetical protein